jgi:hypothetical protein
MALMIDPDDLNQGTDTVVSDMVFGTPTGNAVTITSSGNNLPALGDDEVFAIRDHSETVNNGLYQVDDAAATTGEIDVVKISGANPVAAASESASVLGTTGAGSELSIYYDCAARHVYLVEQGNLTEDGVTEQCVYSRMVIDWKDDDYLIANAPFPMLAISAAAGQFIMGQDPSGGYNGWDWQDNDTYSIRTRKLIRQGGWAAYDADGELLTIYAGIKTLGAFEDEANDTAYYQFGTDTEVDDSLDFSFAGSVNEAIRCYDATVTREVATPDGYDFVDGAGSDDSIERNDSGDFVADGYKVGGKVIVENATTGANDGSYTITSVTTDALGVPTGSLTADTDDNTATLTCDNRAAFSTRLRVRDSDTYGKTFGQATLTTIGETALENRLFAFPLANAADLKIVATDAEIDGDSPYTGMSLTFYDTPQSKGGGGELVGGPYNFGMVLDCNGGTSQQVYEWTQRQLRKTTDIDAGAGTVIGRCMDGLMRFLGDALEAGSVDGGLTFPTNPLGGGSGLYLDDLAAASKNATTLFDNTGAQRSYPVTVTVTLDFNDTLIDDTVAAYTLYWDRTIRNTVSDLVITAGTGANGTFVSSGAHLPASLNRGAGGFVRVSGLTGADAAMNGVYQVTVLDSTSLWHVTRYDGETIVTASQTSCSVDENCIDTPDAIIVKDNLSADVTGLATSDYGFGYDYSNNVQGGHAAGTDAYVKAKAIGQATAQYTQSSVMQIQSGINLTVPLVSAIERNFENPA